MKILAIAVAFFAYVIGVLLWGGTKSLAFWKPENMTVFIPVVVALGVFLRFYKGRRGMSRKSSSVKNSSGGKEEVVSEEEDEEDHGSGEVIDSIAPQTEKARLATAVDTNVTETNENWLKARRLSHQAIPDPIMDGQYLEFVHRAAREGCVEALAKLSEYAQRRGAIVERYYWLMMANKESGCNRYKRELAQIEHEWMMMGCPKERENVYNEFTEIHGGYARAKLRIAMGIDVPVASRRVRELGAILGIS